MKANSVRLVILFLLIIITVYCIALAFFLKKNGVAVISVKNPRCNEVERGKIITQISGYSIRNVEDFENALKSIKSGEYVAMVVDGKPGGCVAMDDGNLGIDVCDLSKYPRFALEISGGSIIILKSPHIKELESIKNIIQNRISIFGLPETYVEINDSLIKISTIFPERVANLLNKYEFKAKILKMVEIENNTGKFSFDRKTYELEKINNSILIDGEIYVENQSFTLDGVVVDVKNVTDDFVTIEFTVFENDDIVKILPGSMIEYNERINRYEVILPVEISENASERFTKVLGGMSISYIGGRPVLNEKLVYYLDERVISTLVIPVEFVEEKITALSVVGFSSSEKDARKLQAELMCALKFGRLPELEIVERVSYLPTMRKLVLGFCGLFYTSVLIIAFTFFYIKSKNHHIGILTDLYVLTESFIVLGIILLTQLVSDLWVINLATISGLSLGVALSLFIKAISFEEYRRERKFYISYKHKNLIKISTLASLCVFILTFILLGTRWKFFTLTALMFYLITTSLTKQLYMYHVKSLMKRET